MRLRAEIRYDADPDAVFAMLTDTAFQERKLEDTHPISYEVHVDADRDGGAVISSSRELPTVDVPDLVRSLVGQSLTVVQVEKWRPGPAGGVREGTVEVEVRGAPVRFAGSLRLAGDGSGGTLETVDGELKARVPMIGGRIERAAEPAIMGAIRVEERTGRAWLARG